MEAREGNSFVRFMGSQKRKETAIVVEQANLAHYTPLHCNVVMVICKMDSVA